MRELALLPILHDNGIIFAFKLLTYKIFLHTETCTTTCTKGTKCKTPPKILQTETYKLQNT